MKRIQKWFSEAESSQYGVLGPYVRIASALPVWSSGTRRLWLLLYLLAYNMSQYAELTEIWDQPRLVISNLYISVLGTTSWVRLLTLATQETRWKLTAAAVAAGGSAGRKSVRIVGVGFWIIIALTMVNIMLPVLWWQPPVSSWWPKSGPQWPLIPVQVISIGFFTIFNMVFDSVVLSTVIALIYQLRGLAQRCLHIYDRESDVIHEIRYCARRHVEIVQCLRELTSVSRWGVLVHFCVCSILVCMSVAVGTSDAEGSGIAMWTGGAIVIHLGLFTTAGTALTTAAAEVRAALSQCHWHRTARHHSANSLCILLIQTEVPLEYHVPPFVTLSTNFFIGVLKAAYSYYTLITER